MWRSASAVPPHRRCAGAGSSSPPPAVERHRYLRVFDRRRGRGVRRSPAADCFPARPACSHARTPRGERSRVPLSGGNGACSRTRRRRPAGRTGRAAAAVARAMVDGRRGPRLTTADHDPPGSRLVGTLLPPQPPRDVRDGFNLLSRFFLPVFATFAALGPRSALALGTDRRSCIYTSPSVCRTASVAKAIHDRLPTSSSALTVAMAVHGDWRGPAVRVSWNFPERVRGGAYLRDTVAHVSVRASPRPLSSREARPTRGDWPGASSSRRPRRCFFDWRVCDALLGVAGLAASLVVARILPCVENFTRSAPASVALVSAAAAHCREPVLV